MEFTNKFHVPLPLDQAWTLMLDVPRILPCLPGARLLEVMDGPRYRGEVTVKLGPIKLSFEGQAEMVRTDAASHTAWLKGAGMDAKGRGAAQSEFSFSLRSAEGGTEVTVHTQLQLSGAIAQYGRGSGMVAEVAAHLLEQFEQNLAQMLLDEPGHAAAAPTPDLALPTAIPAWAPGASAPDAQALYQQSQAVLAQCQAVLATAQQSLAEVRALARTVRPPAARSQELNGLALLWRMLRGGRSGKD